MKVSLLAFIGMLAATSAFAPTAFSPKAAFPLNMAVELTPEPEGGEELTTSASIGDTRMKNMGKFEGETSDEIDGTVYKFWLSATAEGELVKKTRTQLSKEAAKNANFPGFRKGQIPPYAQPQITAFAVQESLIRTVESAVDAFGLKALPGSDGEVTIQEEVEEICKGYNVGDSIPFTATLNAIFDPEKSSASSVGASEDTSEEEEEIVATTE